MRDVCSEIELFTLEEGTVIESHRTSSKMHFWNARNQPRPMSVKNCRHVIEKVGLKSTLGQIGSASDFGSQ